MQITHFHISIVFSYVLPLLWEGFVVLTPTVPLSEPWGHCGTYCPGASDSSAPGPRSKSLFQTLGALAVLQQGFSFSNILIYSWPITQGLEQSLGLGLSWLPVIWMGWWYGSWIRSFQCPCPKALGKNWTLLYPDYMPSWLKIRIRNDRYWCGLSFLQWY